MIRLTLDEMTRRSTRIATSPLWESLSSLALLARYRGEIPYPYTNWARQARAGLPASLRVELLTLTRELHPAWVPSFPVPIPTTPGLDIADELAVMVETQCRPSRRLARFAELLADYWNASLAPCWASMHNVLEEEILFRSRKLATAGAEAMLADLGGRVLWNQPYLCAPYQVDVSHELCNVQLFIVPVLFARGMRIFSRPTENVVAMSYQARGAAVLAEPAALAPVVDTVSGRNDRLAILLGRGRAAVLRAVVAPTTTTAVAEAIGLAPSTVSQHLTALSAAGVVRRHRVGYRVLYDLNQAGVALLNQVGAKSA